MNRVRTAVQTFRSEVTQWYSRIQSAPIEFARKLKQVLRTNSEIHQTAKGITFGWFE